MDVSVLADQQELTYKSSEWTQVAVWNTCRDRWMIGTHGDRERVKEIRDSSIDSHIVIADRFQYHHDDMGIKKKFQMPQFRS